MRQMDTRRDFPVVESHHVGGMSDAQFAEVARALDATPTGLQRDIDRDSAQRLASGALLDLAHEATSAGSVDVAKLAYEAEGAVVRKDPRAAHTAMDKLAAAADGAERAASFASSRELAERRMRDWFSLYD
jgi:hypothetical protein